MVQKVKNSALKPNSATDKDWHLTDKGGGYTSKNDS